MLHVLPSLLSTKESFFLQIPHSEGQCIPAKQGNKQGLHIQHAPPPSKPWMLHMSRSNTRAWDIEPSEATACLQIQPLQYVWQNASSRMRRSHFIELQPPLIMGIFLRVPSVVAYLLANLFEAQYQYCISIRAPADAQSSRASTGESNLIQLLWLPIPLRPCSCAWIILVAEDSQKVSHHGVRSSR